MSKIGDEEIIELHKKGLTDREIAEVLDVSQSSVNYRRKRLGLENNYHKKKKKFVMNEFLKLYNLGYTDREIAHRMDLTPPAIHYRRTKLELRSNNELPDLTEVFNLSSRGYTSQQIARELRVSVAVVRTQLEKAAV
ncbi:MAG: helix-turn-helix domain-containing protein [Euryarchaeota archaeon]|nr:helix-turn-helix domain-containing protein [Euryarchaeota archaeon]